MGTTEPQADTDAALLAALRMLRRSGQMRKGTLIARLRGNGQHSVAAISEAMSEARARKLVMVVDNWSNIALTQAGRALAADGVDEAAPSELASQRRRWDEEGPPTRRQRALAEERARLGRSAPALRTCACGNTIGRRALGEAEECGLCEYRRAQAS